jgi:hypothetical protein
MRVFLFLVQVRAGVKAYFVLDKRLHPMLIIGHIYSCRL